MRVGIAGYGLAGRTFHSNLLKGAGFEVAAIMTSNEERRSLAREDFPQSAVVLSIEELVDEDLDLLVVATHNDAHADHAIAGLEAGIPVVVDKPTALSLDEVDEIFDAADANDVEVTTFFNRIWDSDSLTLKKALGEGILGNVFRMDSRYERFRPQRNPQSWRENTPAEDGGGLLLDLQPHLISTALDWFGPAELVYSSVRSIRGEVDDDVVLVLRHESGVDSYLAVSSIIGAPGPRLRVSGDQGSLIVHDVDKQEALLRLGKHPHNGTWDDDTISPAFLHQGDHVMSYQGVPGNYGTFYEKVHIALELGSEFPISQDFIRSVALIMDQAREESVR